MVNLELDSGIDSHNGDADDGDSGDVGGAGDAGDGNGDAGGKMVLFLKV